MTRVSFPQGLGKDSWPTGAHREVFRFFPQFLYISTRIVVHVITNDDNFLSHSLYYTEFTTILSFDAIRCMSSKNHRS